MKIPPSEHIRASGPHPARRDKDLRWRSRTNGPSHYWRRIHTVTLKDPVESVVLRR